MNKKIYYIDCNTNNKLDSHLMILDFLRIIDRIHSGHKISGIEYIKKENRILIKI